MFENALAMNPPSFSSKSTEYRKVQRGKFPIYDGRYAPQNSASTMAPPVQIYHPVFGYFLDDVSNRDLAVSDDLIRCTQRLMATVSAVHEGEAAMKAEMRAALEAIFERVLFSISNSDQTSLDGLILSAEERAMLIAEFKREVGEGGCDPTIQASLSVLRYLAQREVCCCLLSMRS